MNAQEVQMKLDSFIMEIQSAEQKQEIKTLPEVFGIQYKEVYITKWIAYLLRNKDFGSSVLNALLWDTDISVEDNENISVFTEYVFDDERRIDILVITKKYLIGIENKIWSGEQENQTSDYKNSLEALKNKYNKDEYIGLFLHPELNKSKSNFFKNISFTDFRDNLEKRLPLESSDPLATIMLEQFITYIKECLIMDYPEKTSAVNAYMNYKEAIDMAKVSFDEYVNKFKNWLTFAVEDISKGNYHVSEIKDNYCIIVKKEDWREVDFHFEILWNTSAITEASEVRLAAHLEGHTKRAKSRNNEVLEEKYGERFDNRGESDPLLETKKQDCDFKSEDAARNTIAKILEQFDQDDFQVFAKKAEAYLAEIGQTK